MKFMISYLKQRWRGLAGAAVCVVIFLAAFWLYGLPLGAVLYPAALCLLLGAVLMSLDLRRVRKKQALLSLISSATDLLTGVLPEPEGMEESEYQRILRLLCREQRQLCSTMDLRYGEMVDYYTVWAHQIKTPIAAMRLRLQNEDSQLSRLLSADLLRIEQYVEMVLMFLRLDSDSSDYVIRSHDLDGIVRSAVKKFAGEFINRHLKLEYRPLETTVLTDEKWLSFVIEQVLSNALKYTPAGSISITLEANQTLCIRDTGIGIAPEDLPRIFEKGFTGYNGRSDQKASGIGLYLCKRICRNLGHSITAESAPDRGTVVRIGLGREPLEVE